MQEMMIYLNLVIFANRFLLNNGLQPHNKTQNLFINVIKKKSTYQNQLHQNQLHQIQLHQNQLHQNQLHQNQLHQKSTSPK